ncbi:MAG: type II secretion system protein GspG [Pirellulales bacterium]
MELFAGSLDVEAGTFLHAGYVSAYPRTFEEQGGYGFHDQTKVIDVKKALELKDAESRTVSTTAAAVSSQGHSFPPGSMIAEGFSLAIAFFFFAWIISVYYRRERKIARPGWRPWVLAVVPLLLLGVVSSCAIPSLRSYRVNRLPPPWQGVAVEPYADPAAATDAILQGLIVNAVAGAPQGSRSLAALQEEVAFPVATEEYTPGMAYARRTYGRDGWGKEFTFEAHDDGTCRIASAGPDGVHGTKDDMVALTRRKVNWEARLGGVFIRPATGKTEQYVCLVHRVDDFFFRMAHGEEARKLTGNDLFDAFALEDLARGGSGPPPVLAQLKEQRERQPRDGEPEPLYFVQFTGRYNE